MTWQADLLFGIVFLSVGLGVASLGYSNYENTAELTENSIEVQGEITEVAVEQDVDGTGADRDRVYRPVVEYTYTYEGETYTGDDLTASDITQNFGSESAAREELDEYEEGERITVSIDPKNPTESYLEQESNFGSYFFGFVGVLFGLIGTKFLTNLVRKDYAGS